MTVWKNDLLRTRSELLTVERLDRLVRESLGEVSLLGVVGASNTGKSWAARDWAGSRRDDIERAAYLDCLGRGLGRGKVLHYDGQECTLYGDLYPKMALDGLDILVVDEPACDVPFVRTLLALASPVAGAAAHRLVVLLVQDIRLLHACAPRMELLRYYDTKGTPMGGALP